MWMFIGKLLVRLYKYYMYKKGLKKEFGGVIRIDVERFLRYI